MGPDKVFWIAFVTAAFAAVGTWLLTYRCWRADLERVRGESDREYREALRKRDELRETLVDERNRRVDERTARDEQLARRDAALKRAGIELVERDGVFVVYAYRKPPTTSVFQVTEARLRAAETTLEDLAKRAGYRLDYALDSRSDIVGYRLERIDAEASAE